MAKARSTISAALGDGVLEIYPLSGGVEADQTTRLGFAVSDLESIVECLNEAYVRSKPKQTEWGLRAVVRDPDGRTVELCDQAQGQTQHNDNDNDNDNAMHACMTMTNYNDK